MREVTRMVTMESGGGEGLVGKVVLGDRWEESAVEAELMVCREAVRFVLLRASISS